YWVYLSEDEGVWFPNPRFSPGKGMIAVGGGLSVEWLVSAYKQGLFPWSGRPVTWWSPDPRGILEDVYISKSLSKFIKKNPFEITVDTKFEQVMRECGERRTNGTWITEELITAYTQLHNFGYAHSLECWLNGELVGGVYGVSIGGYFSAESMFHKVSNASKVALVKLMQRLKERDYQLVDIQMLTPITQKMGGTLISRQDFLNRLEKALLANCSFA
ncbi:MAG TPA: leucyl/phenylalanyl-tRNA--protein transferase, partial [Verrucomicrobiota bacterium]|nr:leucyl/phenylalanyl-tRNA--protein transferase [Verrucomicrobiota bacterium]